MKSLLPIVASFPLLLAGCETTNPHGNHAAMDPHAGHAAHGMMTKHENMWETVHHAAAVLIARSDSKVAGTVRFADSPEGLKVTGEVTGLEPNSTHAMHVHEFGDASDPKGMSAGGHYNPEGHKHGGPDAAERHAGDFGNIKADASGKATLNLTFKNVSVAGLKNPIIGRGLVIHAGVDDLKTDPTGNAGGRIAVGVIGVAKP